ncbi:MAG: hypothetical protein Q9165_004896 [Trypethelium subeluteriae]
MRTKMPEPTHRPAALTRPAQGVALDAVELEVDELEILEVVATVDKLLVVDEDGELLLPLVVLVDEVVAGGVNAALLDEGLLLIAVVTRVVVLADGVEALAGSAVDALINTEDDPAGSNGLALMRPADNPAEPAWASVPPADTAPPRPRVELVWTVRLRPTPAESVPDTPSPADRSRLSDVGNRDVEIAVGAVMDNSVVGTDVLSALLTKDEPGDNTDATGNEGLGLVTKILVKPGETDTGGSKVLGVLMETGRDAVDSEETGKTEVGGSETLRLLIVTRLDGIEGETAETEEIRDPNGTLPVVVTDGTKVERPSEIGKVDTVGTMIDVEGNGIETETLREVDGMDTLRELGDTESSVGETLGASDRTEALGTLTEIDVADGDMPIVVGEIKMLGILIEGDEIDDKMPEEIEGIEALGRVVDIDGIVVGMPVITGDIETLGALIDVERIDVGMFGEMDGTEALTDIEGIELGTLGEIDATEALGKLIDIDEITLKTPDSTDEINGVGVLTEIKGVMLETASDVGIEVLGVLNEIRGMDVDRLSDVGIEELRMLARTGAIELDRISEAGIAALGGLSDTDGIEVETLNDIDGIDVLRAGIDTEGIDAGVLRGIEDTDALGTLMDVEGKEVEMTNELGIETLGEPTKVDTIEVGIPSDVDGMDALKLLKSDETAVKIDDIGALGALVDAERIEFETPDRIEGRGVLILPIAVDGMDIGVLSKVDGTAELGAPRDVRVDGMETEIPTDVEGIEILVRLIVTEGTDVDISREIEEIEPLGILADVGAGGTEIEVPNKVEGIVILGALTDVGPESTGREPLSELMEIDKEVEGNAMLGVLADTVNDGGETLIAGVPVEMEKETEGSGPLSVLINVDKRGAETDKLGVLTRPRLVVGSETLETLIDKTDKREVDAEKPGILSEEDGRAREVSNDVREPKFIDEIVALGMLIEVDSKDPGSDRLDRLPGREVGIDSVEILSDDIAGVASEDAIDIEVGKVWGREGDNDSNEVESDGMDVANSEGAEGIDVDTPNELNAGSDGLESVGPLNERDGSDVGKDKLVDTVGRDEESWSPLTELRLMGKDDGKVKLEIPEIPTDRELSGKVVDRIEVGSSVGREDTLSELRDNDMVEIKGKLAEGSDMLADREGRLKDEDGGRIPEENRVRADGRVIPRELKDVVKEGRAMLVEGIEMLSGIEDALSELRDNAVGDSERAGEDNEVGRLREEITTLPVGRSVLIEGVEMFTGGDICGLTDTDGTLVSEDRTPGRLKDNDVEGNVEGRLVTIEDSDAVVGDTIMLSELGRIVFDGSDNDVDTNDNPEDGTDMFRRLVGSSVDNSDEPPDGRDTAVDGVETLKELIVGIDEYSDIVGVESGMLGALGEMYVDWSDSVVDGNDSSVEGSERLDVGKDRFVDGDAINVGGVEGIGTDVGMDKGKLDEGEINDIEGADTDAEVRERVVNGEDRKVLLRSADATGAVEAKVTLPERETVGTPEG